MLLEFIWLFSPLMYIAPPLVFAFLLFLFHSAVRAEFHLFRQHRIAHRAARVHLLIFLKQRLIRKPRAAPAADIPVGGFRRAASGADLDLFHNSNPEAVILGAADIIYCRLLHPYSSSPA